jgi:hypothetical protein
MCIQRAPGCCAIQSINLKRMLQQEITSINFNAVSVQGTMSAFNCLAGRVMWCDETPADKIYLLEWTTHSPSNIRSRDRHPTAASHFWFHSHKRATNDWGKPLGVHSYFKHPNLSRLHSLGPRSNIDGSEAWDIRLNFRMHIPRRVE